MQLKQWNVGTADEDWKVDICNTDIAHANSSINRIEYILGAPVENFTGDEIKKAVLDYISSCRKSIERGGLRPNVDDVDKKQKNSYERFS